MKRLLAIAALITVLSGCAITQNVTPVPVAATKAICIVENPPVRAGFLTEYRSALEKRGYTVKVVQKDAAGTDCAMTSTYLARWSWDIALYMSYAEIQVFRDGQQVGSALYDSRSGGGRPDKFIKADEKIRELVAQLFP